MANTSMEEIPAEGIDISGNLTMFETIAQLPSTLWQQRDLLILQGQIVFAALACIYLGSVASLRRPPSASPPPRKKNKSGGYDKDEDNDDQFVQGLVASDAIMFPILAGTVLVGLYYLIKWLEDPDILNKIMGVYFSVMSLASMGKFLADSLHFLSGFVFPDVCKANDGTVWHFDSIKKCQYRLGDAGAPVYDEKRTSAIPGLSFASEKTNHLLWTVRHLLHEEWTVRFTMHGIAHEKFRVRLNDVLGVVLAMFTSFLYHTTKANFLSNVMGYAFSYVGIITLSPTTFPIGSAVLFGLFFYDIYMVFYT
jgi:minor histocompatibility antigen H13